MDEADCANDYSEHLLNTEINRCKSFCAMSSAPRETCEECGAEIPEARRNAVPGCRLCAPCQEERESEEKLFGPKITRSVV